MKIDVIQPLKEYDGRDVVEPGSNRPVPLRTFLVNALSSAPPSDTGQPARITTESKERRYQLSTKLWKSKKVELDVKERSFLIECVDDAYDSPLICGRIKQVLEGEGQTVPESDDTEAALASSDRQEGGEADLQAAA